MATRSRKENLELVVRHESGRRKFLHHGWAVAQLSISIHEADPDLVRRQQDVQKTAFFFSTVREIRKEDLSFITKPEHPLFLGKVARGSKEMDFDILLPGKEVLSHHVLIPASTGKRQKS